MKVVFDTSVVVAGSVAGHVHQPRATVWLQAARDGRLEARATSHALAETWATLTALPLEPRIAPSDVERLIDRFREHVPPLELTWEDYRASMQRCGDRSLRSGAIYDALHLIAAERCSADVLLTFNTEHFTRLARPDSPRVLAPPDPPGLS